MGTAVYYFIDFLTTLAAGIYFLVKPQDILKIFKKQNNKSFPSIIRGLGILVVVYGMYKLFIFIEFMIGYNTLLK